MIARHDWLKNNGPCCFSKRRLIVCGFGICFGLACVQATNPPHDFTDSGHGLSMRFLTASHNNAVTCIAWRDPEARSFSFRSAAPVHWPVVCPPGAACRGAFRLDHFSLHWHRPYTDKITMGKTGGKPKGIRACVKIPGDLSMAVLWCH